MKNKQFANSAPKKQPPLIKSPNFRKGFIATFVILTFLMTVFNLYQILKPKVIVCKALYSDQDKAGLMYCNNGEYRFYIDLSDVIASSSDKGTSL